VRAYRNAARTIGTLGTPVETVLKTDGHALQELPGIGPEMVGACEARGYEYVAITDHTKAVRVAGGLTAAGFRKQTRAIDALRKRVSTPFVLKGAEVDILEDGSLDLDDETLAVFDIVIASVHSRFTMSKAEMTRRIVRAVQHPRVHILGHPTGRLIGGREPIRWTCPR